MMGEICLDVLNALPQGTSIATENFPFLAESMSTTQYRAAWDFRRMESLHLFPGILTPKPIDYLLQFFLTEIIKIDQQLSLPLLICEFYNTPKDETIYEQFIFDREDILLAFLLVDTLYLNIQDALALAIRLVGFKVHLPYKILRVKWCSGQALYTYVPTEFILDIPAGSGRSNWFQIVHLVS